MRVVIIGASGGIGAALAALHRGRGDRVIALSRADGDLDLADPASIAAAAEKVASHLAGDGLDRLLIATGMLRGDKAEPEKNLASLTADALAESFAINAIGPALVLRHFVPLLPRETPAVVAALSARVGSIADNRLGGWYGYRASKAALNQIVRTAAIELARSRPQSVCVAIHPGTVDTALSRPFQRSVPTSQLLRPTESAARIASVLDALGPSDNGQFFDWKGERLAP